ncbi:unnamed protein product [Effrenium voratum]|nr:unnamed protein product [Effrenium voratum]
MNKNDYAGNYEDRDRGGGADKILVPEFSAEDDRDGVKARGYLRKIEAWRRVTKIKSYKQALMLYNHLTGRAWRDAEELDVEWLDGDSGMDYFIDWIRNRYLDREVIKVGKYMTDFFKNLKKHNNQDVKEFNQEFDRQAARLKEVGCALPDVCLAWWYMDKLRLDNATELNLLSSTGNDYNLYKLQDAAIIQDRMNRRLWESHRGRNNDKYDQNKKGQQAYVTEELGEGQSEDEESELDMDVEGIDEEAEEAYVTYQNAKSKYRTIMNARGINPKANQEERIKAAKARSYCSACKKKGHWHKDPECPLNQKNPQGDKRDAHQVKFCHVAYMTDSMTETELYGITDCACSRTVAGRPWIRRMVRKAKENNIPYFFMAQEENFKFGGPDIFRSERALVVWLQINGAPFILKIAEVKCVLPLLLSRNVLAGLGMCYDISKHVADFSELGVEGYKLGQTETGHPMVVVTGGGICWPSWPEAVDWSVVECDVHRPARSCYMVHGGAGRTELAVDRPPIRYMPELKPWKMKRAELVEKLDDLLIDYDQKATVPELQEILKKHLTKTEELAKGYTRFTVGELREMCNKKKLRVPATANKGCLIQALRYAEGGHSKEEISFGRYKGKTYEAIPMDYRLWAVEEVSKNETPAAALVRFATWAKRWMELEALEEEVIDPEEAAVVAPPKSTMDFKPTIRKKAMTSTTTAKRATPATSDSDGSWLQADPMDSETDADANKKILELWKRRRYWAVREGRAKQKAVAKLEKIGEPRESSGDLTVNEDNLDYDDDIEHRINSCRGRKVKNSTRKMIGSWTRKVWQAFLSTAVALAGPVMVEANEAVVEPIKDLYNATVLPRFGEEGQPYVLEVFAGKNHITQAFAAKGYDVMEPRDLLLGHDIRIKEVRENILEDIRKFKPMTSVIKDYHLLECNLDMCAYGLKGKSDGKLLKKPTKLLVSSEIYHHELARRCDKRHDHGQTAGANTAPSACYTWSFARAVVEATCKVDSSYVTAYVADAGEEDVGGDQQPEDDLVGASGIKLPKATSAATASALRRIHQNLGHPSNKDLTRHLRLCGATEEAIKGAQGLRCDTCQRLRRPGTQRPAKTVLPMDFNDEVAVDLFYLYDQGKVKHSILSVMDLASGYHVCRKIQSKLSEDLAESVRQLWLEWAGMPKRMVCDQERGFQKNFVDEMENRGIHVKYIAGQAHWQLGQLERQQGWLRTMWEKVVEHENINFQEAEWALLQVVQAKNNLRRRHGTDSQTEDKNYYQQTLRAVQSMQKDLRQLLERIDDDGVDDEEIFHDASNLMEDGDAEAYRKQKRQWPDGVPRRRMRQKGPVPHAVEDDLRDGEDEYSPSVAAPDEEITGMDFVNDYADKSEGDDIQDVDEAMWTTHKRTPKTIAKQRDKEVAWNDIPAAEKELYVAAEKKQWDEHVKYGAVRILSAQDKEFEYIGSQIKQADGVIELGQCSYVKSRLETTEMPKEHDADELADEERMEDFYKVHGKEADFDINKGIVDQGVYSQLGHVLVMAHRNVLEGEKSKAVICEWKSHACPRVCRSTFAAETMAALEGIEDAMAFRASLAGAQLDHDYEMDPHDLSTRRPAHEGQEIH